MNNNAPHRPKIVPPNVVDLAWHRDASKRAEAAERYQQMMWEGTIRSEPFVPSRDVARGLGITHKQLEFFIAGGLPALKLSKYNYRLRPEIVIAWLQEFSPEHLPRDRERASIPPSVREAIYERDGHKCVRCGALERLQLDHIYPWSLGGSDEPENLQTLCASCNSAKWAHVVEEGA